MVAYRLSRGDKSISGDVFLPPSKSLSNRALIISSLAGDISLIQNLSDADDTKVLKSCLEDSSKEHYETGLGGTTFRFLLAYKALSGAKFTIRGTDHFNKRPVAPLVDALRKLGVEIRYLNKVGYPPLEIRGFEFSFKESHVEVDAGISSQFVSALMMVAPYLPGGLNIRLLGEVVSFSYLKMTAGLMAYFGIVPLIDDNVISIPPGRYMTKEYYVEGDWSAASYFYSMVSMAEVGEIRLRGIRINSLQGDSTLMEIGEYFGVETLQLTDDALLIKKANRVEPRESQINLIDAPDLAPALIVASAALELNYVFTGLKTLRIKESDRIQALKMELLKTGFKLESHVEKDETLYSNGKLTFIELPVFETYNDHRIAMALAPISLFNEIEIVDPDVVSKSFPGFWRQLSQLGFRIKEV